MWVLVISQFPCLVHRLLLFQLSYVSFVCSLRSRYCVFFFSLEIQFGVVIDELAR